MNQQTSGYLGRTLVSGTIAGLATAATAALAGKRETTSYLAPVNATSHIAWGDIAATQDGPSLKYTLTGFLLNHAATIFWAAAYEKLVEPRAGDRDDGLMRPVLGAVAVTAGAYVTDYYLVPRRFTPGWEKRLSGRSLAVIYGAMALGLVARGLAQRRRT
ncbi:MAG TPA: hypothetical protein VIM12_07885 [Noviherbaspirillum sp.]|jgi:hypothetical protein|uniref:hypothetical protein n=1 Tax=Noviherbaspirillum sp. TaxID=1926288 RepID=UPI002F91D4B5